MNPFDLFWYWDPYYYRNNRARIQQRGKYNFVESVFSFVFGDGDPNEDYDSKRWEGIARLIRENEGVVTAEQLAPYVDAAPILSNSTDIGFQNDEGFVLPVLQRFRGVPEVDATGNIFYCFPDFQRTTDRARQTRSRRLLPGFSLERKWSFSEAESGQILGAVLLGAANFIGVFYLNGLLRYDTMVCICRVLHR